MVRALKLNWTIAEGRSAQTLLGARRRETITCPRTSPKSAGRLGLKPARILVYSMFVFGADAGPRGGCDGTAMRHLRQGSPVRQPGEPRSQRHAPPLHAQ